MLTNGSECSIVIRTTHKEIDVPYSDETLREAVSFLEENAPIEGDGICRGILKYNGITGCVVTPLTIDTTPLLLFLAMGACGNPVFISETKNLFKYQLNLVPMENTQHFDVVQDRKNECLLFEYCCCHGFELRIMRDETIKLKLDIESFYRIRTYPHLDMIYNRENTERFKGDCVTYKINGKEYKNIYGITLVSKKKGGTKTEIWIKRALKEGSDIPTSIEEFIITAQLLRDKYEYRHFGTFRITIKRMVLIGDETEVNACDAVISPLRFYASGGITTEVFTSGKEYIA